MGASVVYSIKVDADHLDGMRKFFARWDLPPQEVFRGLVTMAAHCESCLSLAESKAPISEIQSSFATVLADAKQISRLNGLFQDTVLNMAEVCNVPRDFIMNVLTEAQRIYTRPPEER